MGFVAALHGERGEAEDDRRISPYVIFHNWISNLPVSSLLSVLFIFAIVCEVSSRLFMIMSFFYLLCCFLLMNLSA